MVVSVEVICEDATYPLEKDNKTGFYTAKIESIKKFKVGEESKYCPIMLCVTDNKGNAFTKTISNVEIKDDLLLIKEEQLFPLKFIVANEKGEELEYIKEANRIDKSHRYRVG